MALSAFQSWSAIQSWKSSDFLEKHVTEYLNHLLTVRNEHSAGSLGSAAWPPTSGGMLSALHAASETQPTRVRDVGCHTSHQVLLQNSRARGNPNAERDVFVVDAQGLLA